MRSYWKKPKFLNSAEAENGATSFIDRLKTHQLDIEVLPNSYEEFTGQMEEEDFIAFSNFLKSSNGRSVLEMVETEDGL